MRALLAVALVLPLAGCASVTLEGPLARHDTPPAEYREFRDIIGPSYDRAYAIEIGERARAINATLTLHTRGEPIPAPALTPARLTLQILDPAGIALAQLEVDAANPTTGVLLEQLPARGAYELRITGNGVAGALDGADYGASYLLAVEIPQA